MTLNIIDTDHFEDYRGVIVKALASRLMATGQVPSEESEEVANQQLEKQLEAHENYFFDIGEGVVWLMSQQPGQLSVNIPAGDSLNDALVSEMEAWGADNDYRILTIFLSDKDQLPRYEQRGYVASNVNMEKHFTSAPQSTLKLVPMSPERFDVYLEKVIVEYGQEKLKAGNFSEETWLEQSREEIMRLIPEKTQTPGQFMFVLHNETDEDVGILWIARRPVMRGEGFWIYDIEVDENHRRKGYGTQTLLALEAFTISEGLDRIGLHVFGHNHGARALYDMMGFETLQVVIKKTLSD